MKWISWLLLALVAAVLITDRTVPDRNTNLQRFDTLIVLGSPAMWNGEPSPEERARVLEGVREYHAGRAPHLILSGGAAYNQWVEAEVMRGIALRAGVPAAAIEVEGQSKNTIQNIFYSDAILRQHGWTSAEIVSSPEHLPRCALILEHWPFQWRTHASPQPPEFSPIRVARGWVREALGVAELRWFGFSRSPFLPGSGRHLPRL